MTVHRAADRASILSCPARARICATADAVIAERGHLARGDDGPGSDNDLLLDPHVHALGLLPVGVIADELSDPAE